MKRVGPNCDCAIWTGAKDGWRRWHAHPSDSLGQHDARREVQRDVQKQASFFLRLGARTSRGGVFTRLVLTSTEALASTSLLVALALTALAPAFSLGIGITHCDTAITTGAATARVDLLSLTWPSFQLRFLARTEREASVPT